MGEAHVDVVLDRLSTRYGVTVDSEPVRVSLRETFSAPARGHGRLVKQSGGHGQYAVCDIEVTPLPAGSGFEFVDQVVGGAVPRQFIASVEKGVRAQMTKGVGAGYPMVDIQVTLVDGKAHSVDSSDMAFQTAGALALKDAADAAGVTLLEPIDELVIVIPDEHVGAVMSDLSGRRGRVTGTEGVPGGGPPSPPKSPGSNSPGTPSSYGASLTAPRRSRVAITVTSRCRRTWPKDCPQTKRGAAMGPRHAA